MSKPERGNGCDFAPAALTCCCPNQRLGVPAKAAEQLCDQRSWIHMGCAAPTMVQGGRLCRRQPMQPAHLDVESTQIGRRRRSLETSRHRAGHDGVQMKVVHCTALPSINRGPICVLSQYRVSALVCHKLAHFLVAQTTDCVQAKQNLFTERVQDLQFCANQLPCLEQRRGLLIMYRYISQKPTLRMM